MAININGTKLKKCNLNGVKVKKINVNGVNVFNSVAPELPYVLKDGLDAQTDATGGWDIAKVGDHWYGANYDEYTRSIRLAQTSRSGHRYGWITSGKKVDITGYSKLVLRASGHRGYGDAEASNGWIYLCLSNTVEAPMTKDRTFSESVVLGNFYEESSSTQKYNLLEIDISSLEGEYYIQAGQRTVMASCTFSCFLHDIYFIE